MTQNELKAEVIEKQMRILASYTREAPAVLCEDIAERYQEICKRVNRVAKRSRQRSTETNKKFPKPRLLLETPCRNASILLTKTMTKR